MVILTGSPGEAARILSLRATLAPGAALVALANRQANLDPATVAACDAILTTRLASPDWPALEHEAQELATRHVAGEVRLTLAAVHLPLAVGETGPFVELDSFASDQRAMPLVLSNGIVLGGQGDVKHWGITVVVMTDYDLAYARNLADDLAEAVWERRAEFAQPAGGADDLYRRCPLWPFELDTAWTGVTFGD